MQAVIFLNLEQFQSTANFYLFQQLSQLNNLHTITLFFPPLYHYHYHCSLGVHPGADKYPTRLILIDYEQLIIQVPDVVEARAIVVLATVALSTEA